MERELGFNPQQASGVFSCFSASCMFSFCTAKVMSNFQWQKSSREPIKTQQIWQGNKTQVSWCGMRFGQSYKQVVFSSSWMNQLGNHPDFNQMQGCSQVWIHVRPALSSCQQEMEVFLAYRELTLIPLGSLEHFSPLTGQRRPCRPMSCLQKVHLEEDVRMSCKGSIAALWSTYGVSVPFVVIFPLPPHQWDPQASTANGTRCGHLM